MNETRIVSRELSKLVVSTVSRKVVNEICLPVLIRLQKQHLNKRLSEIKSVVVWSNNVNGGSSIKGVSPVGCMKGPVFQFIDE